MIYRSIILTILFVHTFAIPIFPFFPFFNWSCDCVCGDSEQERQSKIVGGEETKPNQYPWMVGLYEENKFFCAGSIITRKHVLTAAHCVRSKKSDEIQLYFGIHNVSDDYIEIRQVYRIYEHENFDGETLDSDIAILEMDRPIEFGPNIRPICLPQTEQQNHTGKLALVAGWGQTGENDDYASTLRHAVVEIWSKAKCDESNYVVRNISDNMICAGYEYSLTDSCQGDSGGPMHAEGETGSMELIGVVSWGRGCARPNLPGVYTRVDSFLPWIKQKLNGQCLCKPKIGNRTDFLKEFVALSNEGD